MKRGEQIRLWLAVLLVLVGAARFLQSGLWPAIHLSLGDFRASFPTAYFAWLRPDFPTERVWPGWTYGPLLHFLTLPLFLAPRWSWVGPMWATANLVATLSSFAFAWRLSAPTRRASLTTFASVAALWLWFKPLQMCFADGNIELVELAITLAALDAVTRARQRLPGVLLGAATMLKFAPIGFLGWLGLRGHWRSVKSGVVTIVIIAAVAQVTLGWQNNGLALRTLWDRGIPQVNADTQSVTSVFLHRAGVINHTDGYYAQRWFPTSRASVAAQAGELACVLLMATYGAFLLWRRRRAISPLETSALFLPMLLLLTSNHQYYYVFALVPITVLFLRSVADRQWGVLTLVLIAYFMMSAPFRFTWIDRSGYFSIPFFYVLNYSNVMAFGALLLWGVATYQMLGEPVEPATRASVVTARRTWVPATVAVIAVAGMIAVAFVMRTGAPLAASRTIALSETSYISQSSAMALSPDGARIAYVTTTHRLCIRELASNAAKCWDPTLKDGSDPLDDPAGPFFSPDGRWLGFIGRGILRKIPLDGGALQTINGRPEAQTASWAANGTMLLSTPAGIVQIGDSGGVPQIIVARRPEEGPFLSPILNKAANVVIFTIGPAGGAKGAGTIVAQSLKTGRRKDLLPGSQPYFDEARGVLVYALGGRVFAVPFSAEALEVSDISVPIIGDVVATAGGGVLFGISANGTLFYAPQDGRPEMARTLSWVDRKGVGAPLPFAADVFETPRISSDGKWLAVSVRDVQSDIWLYDLANGGRSRIYSPANRNYSPVWLRNTGSLLFVAAGSPARAPVLVSSGIADGGRLLATYWELAKADSQSPFSLTSANWDGSVMVGTLAHTNVGDQISRTDLWVVNTAQPDAGMAVKYTRSNERDPVVSPDGKWVAYSSDKSGHEEVYVLGLPGFNQVRQVSFDGGTEPVWSRDGRELFYRGWVHGAGKLQMMAVPVSTQGALVVGTPVALFDDIRMEHVDIGATYDVAPDGQHFVLLNDGSPTLIKELRVVPRWFDRLPK